MEVQIESRFALLDVPVQLFETTPSTSDAKQDSRILINALERFKALCERGLHQDSMIRLNQLSYVRANSFRHFHMWRQIKSLYAVLKKILPKELKDWMTNVHQRLTQSSHFPLTTAAIEFLQMTVYEQLSRLEITRRRGILATNGCLDYLDVGHWLSQSMVFIGIIADVVTNIRNVTIELLEIYTIINSHSRANRNLPTSDELKNHFSVLIEEINVVKPSPLLKGLMDISSNVISKSKIQTEVKQIESIQSTSVDVGVTINREEFETSNNDVTIDEGVVVEEVLRKKKKIKRKLNNSFVAEVQGTKTKELKRKKKRVAMDDASLSNEFGINRESNTRELAEVEQSKKKKLKGKKKRRPINDSSFINQPNIESSILTKESHEEISHLVKKKRKKGMSTLKETNGLDELLTKKKKLKLKSLDSEVVTDFQMTKKKKKKFLKQS